MKRPEIVKLLANKINQPHVIETYLKKVEIGAYNKGVADTKNAYSKEVNHKPLCLEKLKETCIKMLLELANTKENYNRTEGYEDSDELSVSIDDVARLRRVAKLLNPKTKRVTVHKVDGKWKALPESSYDLYFGRLTPGQGFIKEHAIDFVENTDTKDFKENQIIEGQEIWENDEDKIIIFKFEIK